MSAHILPIVAPKCRCGAKATCLVRNTFNAEVGRFCRRCAAATLKTLLDGERVAVAEHLKWASDRR